MLQENTCRPDMQLSFGAYHVTRLAIAPKYGLSEADGDEFCSSFLDELHKPIPDVSDDIYSRVSEYHSEESPEGSLSRFRLHTTRSVLESWPEAQILAGPMIASHASDFPKLSKLILDDVLRQQSPRR